MGKMQSATALHSIQQHSRTVGPVMQLSTSSTGCALASRGHTASASPHSATAQRQHRPRECAIVRAVAAPAEAPAKSSAADREKSVELAIRLCEQAAVKRNVSAPQVIKALSTIEKAKLPYEPWPRQLGSSKPGGHRWQLIFQAGAERARKSLSGKPVTLPGIYFPIPAFWRWDEEHSEIEIGVFLGMIAALTFRGSFKWEKRKQNFVYDTVRLRLGPKWFDFPIKKKDKSADGKQQDRLAAFFNFFLVNDNICAARGKDGGVAIWARISPVDDVKAGAML